MSQHISESGTPTLLSATGIISEAPGALLGFYVNSTSSGTIVLSTGGASGATSGGTAVSGTITPAVGFHRFPMQTPDRLYATIGATISVTFIFQAG